METVGEICSQTMLVWLFISAAKDFTKNKYLTHFINETLYIIPVVVIIWFLFSGDVTQFSDILRLFVWGWFWYDAYRNRDDRWKRRRKRLAEKVKVLNNGKLAVVPT